MNLIGANHKYVEVYSLYYLIHVVINYRLINVSY